MNEIAKILKPQGIHGEVKVQLFSNNFETFCERGFAYIKQGDAHRRITYTAVRKSPPYVYLQIDGVNTRNDADDLQGVFLFVERQDFDAPEEGEYYICDLIGLSIVDQHENKLGVLKEILQNGAADVYVVKGKKGFMFPALKRVVKNVDVKNGVVRVDAEALQEVAVYDDL